MGIPLHRSSANCRSCSSFIEFSNHRIHSGCCDVLFVFKPTYDVYLKMANIKIQS